MNHWIISSKHSRDESTGDWDSKWTTDAFLKSKRFFPKERKQDFTIDDLCLLKVFGSQDFIGDFQIASEVIKDGEGDIYYEINNTEEWDFPVNQHQLPPRYTGCLSRHTSIKVKEEIFLEMMGIKNFMQNLKINYKNRLRVKISERQLEEILDTKNSLRQMGLEILDRQKEITPGNIIDLLCKNDKGDLVVVELKKGSADDTIGQLARYVTDVREYIANSTQKVHGLILALDIDEQLIKAARAVDYEVVLYQLIPC